MRRCAFAAALAAAALAFVRADDEFPFLTALGLDAPASDAGQAAVDDFSISDEDLRYFFESMLGTGADASDVEVTKEEDPQELKRLTTQELKNQMMRESAKAHSAALKEELLQGATLDQEGQGAAGPSQGEGEEERPSLSDEEAGDVLSGILGTLLDSVLKPAVEEMVEQELPMPRHPAAPPAPEVEAADSGDDGSLFPQIFDAMASLLLGDDSSSGPEPPAPAQSAMGPFGPPSWTDGFMSPLDLDPAVLYNYPAPMPMPFAPNARLASPMGFPFQPAAPSPWGMEPPAMEPMRMEPMRMEPMRMEPMRMHEALHSVPADHEPMMLRLADKDGFYIVTGWFPGVEKEDFKVSLNGDTLRISATISDRSDRGLSQGPTPWADVADINEDMELPYKPDAHSVKAHFDAKRRTFVAVMPMEQVAEISLQ